MEVVLIAAVAENGVMGRDNALPWRLRSDLKRFRTLTLGKPVVMGRKTFVSIGKALPGRTNIVLTRERNFTGAGILVAYELAMALALARADALRRGVNEFAIIGGGELFALTMNVASRIELTRVHATPAGDTHFPHIDPDEWSEVARQRHRAEPGDSADVTFVTYIRRARWRAAARG